MGRYIVRSSQGKNLIILVTFLKLLAVLAIFLPSIHLVLNLNGAVAGLMIAVILPILIYNKAFKGHISWFRLIFHYLIIAVCTGFALVSVGFTLVEMF
jgi:hypothetical protein